MQPGLLESSSKLPVGLPVIGDLFLSLNPPSLLNQMISQGSPALLVQMVSLLMERHLTRLLCLFVWSRPNSKFGNLGDSILDLLYYSPLRQLLVLAPLKSVRLCQVMRLTHVHMYSLQYAVPRQPLETSLVTLAPEPPVFERQQLLKTQVFLDYPVFEQTLYLVLMTVVVSCLATMVLLEDCCCAHKY